MSLKMTNLKLEQHPPETNELRGICVCATDTLAGPMLSFKNQLK